MRRNYFPDSYACGAVNIGIPWALIKTLRAFWTWASYIAYAVGIIAGYIGSCVNKRRRRRT